MLASECTGLFVSFDFSIIPHEAAHMNTLV